MSFSFLIETSSLEFFLHSYFVIMKLVKLITNKFLFNPLQPVVDYLYPLKTDLMFSWV